MAAREVGGIRYELLRGGRRKTVDVVIERDGRVAVRAPAHFPEEQADAVVRRKRFWIHRSLAEWRDLNATRVAREWVNGEGFLYLGSSYRLLLVPGQDAALVLRDGRFCLRRELIDDGGPVAAKAAFEDFYRAKGLERFRRRVDCFAAKVGVTPASVRVGEIGYRWAACAPSGGLRFHWKCMMAPPKVIDYIVVHELCHLRHRDHGDAFWNEVDKVMPDFSEGKQWLRNHGAALDL